MAPQGRSSTPRSRPERPTGGPGRDPTVPPAPEAPRSYPDCPLCAKPVKELASALTHRGSGRPAHFDCIVREIRESTEVGPQERLCYLGGGSFGVLEFRPSGGPGAFVIKRRIQYEEKDPPAEWKKPLLLVR
ncbi:MAG TPA: hypothetical protein VFH83_09130 [Spirochaetia bacterium]|nr:hypothetical protein [Spirochaetia bacterium]